MANTPSLRSSQVVRPGYYRYVDDVMGSPEEKVEVLRVDGTLMVRFRDDDNGDALVELEPLTGLFAAV